MRPGPIDRAVGRYRRFAEAKMARQYGLTPASAAGKRASIFDKCAIGLAYLDPLIRTGNYTRMLESVDGAVATMGGKRYVSFSRCDYLGLTMHPKVIEAALQAIAKYGTSVSSSRLAAGTIDLHIQLEEKIAEFVGGEACIVYMMGYLANLGTIPALVQQGEFVVSDESSHASIVDACVLAKKDGAKVVTYKHSDMADLERQLRRCGQASNALIVTDGVFSMDGDLAPLPEIVRLAREYNAGVLVDDAHGAGVVGANGRGTAEVFNMIGQVDLTMVTLSKAFPGLGGCIVGRKEIIDFLKVTSRSFIFNVSLPPVNIATALAALEVIKEEPQLRAKLWENINYMMTNLRRLGYDLGQAEAAIIPIFIRDDAKANELTAKMKEAGFMVDPMVYPAVGKNQALIRLVINSTHDLNDLARAIGVFDWAGKQLGII